MTISAYLTDSVSQLTVLNDRAQGVVSMTDGTLEVMVHRRTLQDDARGVGEPLNETLYMSPYPDAVRSGPGLVITGTHYLYLSNASSAAATWRPAAQRVYAPFLAAFAALEQGQSVSDYLASHVSEASFLAAGADLPLNVDLVSLQTWAPWSPSSASSSSSASGAAATQVMLRLAHMFAVGEDAALSLPVQVDLDALFQAPPTSVAPMSLTVNQPAAAVAANKLQWNIEGEGEDATAAPAAAAKTESSKKSSGVQSNIVTINPMEVLTFILTF